MKTIIFTVIGILKIGVIHAEEPLWQGTGRIAISSDGNSHDHDDWAATPLSLALIASQSLQERLVLYTYSDHVWGSDGHGGRGFEEMKISAEEGKERFGFKQSKFMAAVENPEAAYMAMASAINESSKGNPLFIIAAGPMQVVGEGIQRSELEKRKFVTVITHSYWNNTHSDNPEKYEKTHEGWTFDEMKAAFSGKDGGKVRLVQIKDQNGGGDYVGLNADRSSYDWIKTSDSRNHKAYQEGAWDWLYSRLETCKKNSGKNYDPSDAGMIVYLFTGVEKTNPSMVKKLMENPVGKNLNGNN